MTSREPSMMTPPIKDSSDCPIVELPIPPNPKTDTCSENKSYVKFSDKIKNGATAAVKVGLSVDKRYVDILGSFSNKLINVAALTAAYTALMITFPDIEKKVNIHFEAAQKGWEAAQKKETIEDGFSIGYINYFMPAVKSQQKWIEDESKPQISHDPLVRALAKGFRNPGVNVTAKGITLAARAATATINAVTNAAYLIRDEASDMTLSESENDQIEKPTEEKIKQYGGYLDSLSIVGETFTKKRKYFNKTVPAYLQRFGQMAPYVILASLVPVAVRWISGDVATATLPWLASFASLASSIASSAITGSQVVAEVKSKAAIDSLEFVILKLYDVLKNTTLKSSDYSDIIARLIVGVSCPAYATRDEEDDLFSTVDYKQVSILLYFWRYASYAYCLDPETLEAADFAECVEINKQFSRRYYPIMQNVKGVKGWTNSLVNFFLVYDLTLGCFVASFQGTTTLDDLLIDACGKPVDISFTNAGESTVKGYAHERMLDVAQNCVAILTAYLEKEHPFYRRVPIILTGHSLGAGIAAISALLLREKGLQAYCLGIATPACLSPELASACKSFTVSVVNNSDIVPRLSECGLFNMTSSERVCFRTNIKKLVTPGNVLWMRQKIEIPLRATQELVQLTDKSEFSTSILARTDCLSAHGLASYFESLKSVDPNANADLIDFDFSFLFPNMPSRKLEPEFLMLYLPKNVADAIKTCFEKSGSDSSRDLQLRAQRRLEKKANRELNKEESKQSADLDVQEKKHATQLLALRDECKKSMEEVRSEYSQVVKENQALKEKLAKLNKGSV